MKYLTAVIILTALWPILALANIVYVPQDQPTIQSGINAAVDGDTVLVADSLYYENINFKGKKITVASYFLMDSNTVHIDNTIIDGSQPSDPDSASVVFMINGEDTTSILQGFTIRGGTGTNTMEGGLMWRAGGGIFCRYGSGATLRDNRVIANRLDADRAIGGGIVITPPDGGEAYLVLEGNTISDNRATGTVGNAGGGGIYVHLAMHARIAGNVFERDTVISEAYASGGAIYMWAGGTLADGVIQNNTFRENIAEALASYGGLGGAISMYSTGPVTISENIFEDNMAKSGNGWGEGGAILLEDTNVPNHGRKMVTGNRFINNLASSQFGNGRGGAIELYNSLATISGNYCEQNAALGGTAVGGAIRIFSSAFLMENNICGENTALYGGAIHISGTPQSGTDLDIINNTIVNNTASSTGGGIYATDSIKVINSIFWGNTPNQIGFGSGGSVQVHYSDIQGGWPQGDGNINADPLFVPGDSLFHLTNNSPCVNTGADSIQIGGQWYYCPPYDYEGDQRPFANTRPDIGADETDVIEGIEPMPNAGMPQSYALEQNYPNPFNPTTNVEFSIPKSEFVTLKVFNILGEEVATLVSEKLPAGNYKYDWPARSSGGDASSLASGVYLYRIQAGEYVESKKMVLLR